MSDRLLVDLDASGRVTVGVQRGEELPDFAGAPFELSWPLDGDELEDLRWYLEDYLRYPYGADGARGERIAASLPRWGEAVFASIFGSGAARDAYVSARRGGAPPEVVLRSASAGFLGLPWALMHDPDRPSPVALDLVGVSRSLPVAALAESFAVEGDVLRVLMIISRPAGADDVGYRMVARPLLERLDAVRGRVELTVLRPPTLDALARTLAAAREAGTPFQIVHFDGHGVLAGADARAVADLCGTTARAARACSYSRSPRAVPIMFRPRAWRRCSRRRGCPSSCSTPASRARSASSSRPRSRRASCRRASRRSSRWPTRCTQWPPPSSWPPSTSGCSRARA